MIKFLARRIATSLPLLVIVSFAVFVLIDLVPGDPAFRFAGENPSPELVEQVRRALHLNDPLIIRYGRWIGSLLMGSFGQSMSTTESVTAMIAARLPTTVSLISVALLISTIVGLALGIWGAMYAGKLPDRIVTAFGAIGIAVPAFWVGLLLVVFFAVDRDWFPALGYTPLSSGVRPWLWHLALPAATLALVPAAEMAVQVKDSLTEVMGREYVLAAYARGLSPGVIVFKHALKNAAIPVVTVLGFRVAQLIGGTVIVESVFSLQGLGTLAITSALSADVPVLLGLTMLTMATVVMINIAVDISYLYFNPKVRGR